MLGAAEADALGAELTRLRRILRRVRVRPHAQPAGLVGPREDGLEVLVHPRRDERHPPGDDAPAAAVDRDHVSLGELAPVDHRRSLLEPERVATGHGRLAHPAGDDGRVRGHPAVRGQDAARPDEAVDVVRRRLPAHEDDVFPVAAALLRRVRVEDDGAGRRAGRGVQALGEHLHLGRRVDHRMEELVELAGVDADDRLLPRDQLLRGHVDGDAQRGGRGSLSRARLQEVQPALLDRELDVLHLPVVALEARERREELLVRRRQRFRHPLDRLGRTDARDDVLALRVDEELAEHPGLPRGRVAGEGHAGRGRVASVAEDHLHDVRRRAEVVGDPARAPVDLGTGRVPRAEHGADGGHQLDSRILRELGVLRLDGRCARSA